MVYDDNMSLIDMFFFYLKKKKIINVIDSINCKKGIAIDTCITYAFAEEYEEYEEGYFGKNGLKIVVLEPLMDCDKEAVYSIEEFINGIMKFYNENRMLYNLEERNIIESKLYGLKV